jgi:hypothetical protein
MTAKCQSLADEGIITQDQLQEINEVIVCWFITIDTGRYACICRDYEQRVKSALEKEEDFNFFRTKLFQIVSSFVCLLFVS